MEKSEIQDLLDEKLRLQLSQESNWCKLVRNIVQNQIEDIESKLSKLCAARNYEIVNSYTKTLGTSAGNFSQLGMWRLKNKLMPLEMAKLKVIPLSMVDDLLAAVPCGFKSIEMDVFMNTMVELKKLRFRIPEEGKKKAMLESKPICALL